jgi:hypothetical protein
VRFFISRLYRVDQVESMPRNNPHGKINRTAKRSLWRTWLTSISRRRESSRALSR